MAVPVAVWVVAGLIGLFVVGNKVTDSYKSTPQTPAIEIRSERLTFSRQSSRQGSEWSGARKTHFENFTPRLKVLHPEIQSDLVTNWGTWGEYEHCMEDGIVTALNCKVDSGFNNEKDDTALNGIALRCNAPEDINRLTSWITSSEGRRGQQIVTEACPFGAYVYGFKFRTQSYLNGMDDYAAENIILYCRYPNTCGDGENSSSDLILKGHGDTHDHGSRQTPKFFPPDHGICGIQTQVEPFTEDSRYDQTGLNNVAMACCKNEQTSM